MTEEQLSDVDGMRALIDNRLSLMVKLEVERQLLQTDGTSNTINGFYNQVTQTQALGSDVIFDAILKGANKVRTVGMAEPDAVSSIPTSTSTCVSHAPWMASTSWAIRIRWVLTVSSGSAPSRASRPRRVRACR